MANWNQLLEDAIVGRLIGSLVEEGYRLEVSDQDGGGLFVYAVPDGGKKPKSGFEYWVRIVPGNGADVIADFTTNLEKVIAPANALADQYRD